MPTAEEAAAANLAWRAVNLPSSVTPAEQAQAAQYRSYYYNVEQPAQQARDAQIQQTIIQNRQMINRQEGLEYGGVHTQAQYAAMYGSAEAGRVAYAQEQEYYEQNPSAEFQRITNQYNIMKSGTIVTGNRVYFASGELELSDPSEEQYGAVYSGRAAEYKSAFDREVYGIGAIDNEREYYRRQAEMAAVARPGYTAPSDLGDIRTQQMRQSFSMFSSAIGMQGGVVASDYQMTGKFLEAQRQGAYATPTRRDERFFMGELQKWAEVPVEKSAAYHDIGMESGERIPANPFEYQADLAVEFLKGSPKKSSEFFSPVSGEMSQYLPKGEGVQEFAWREAITDYKRQNVDANYPYPEQVSFMPAVEYLGAAEGKYGPYGKLYGGIDNGGVNQRAGSQISLARASAITGGGEYAKAPFVSARYITPPSDVTTRIEQPRGEVFGTYIPVISEGVAFFEPKTKVTETTAIKGDTRTITTVAAPMEGTSGLDELNANIRKTLNLPSVEVGEKGLEISSAMNPLSTGFLPVRAGKQAVFGAAEFAGIQTTEARKTDVTVVSTTDVYKGQYQAFYEQPLLMPASYAAGAAFGTVFKGATAIGGAIRSKAAPAIISRGQTARAAEIYGAGVWKTAQVGMVGLYAADLSGRATKGFTDFSPASVAPRARAMAVQEVYPMMVGFGAPDRVVKSVRVAEIGYKQALLAGKGEPAGRLAVSVEGTPRSATVAKYLELNKWNIDTAGMPLGSKPTYKATPDVSRTVGTGWGVSEPTTTGRFDWYIKQPVTRAASHPIDLIKQDYRAFVQEATAKTPVVKMKKPGMMDYLSYKLEPTIAPEPTTIRTPQRYKPTEYGLEPVSTEYGPELARSAYGKQRPVFKAVAEKFGAGKTPKPESPTLRTSEGVVYREGKWSKVIREPVGEVSPELSIKAYGKQKTIFESPAKVVQEPHQYARYISEKTASKLSSVYKTEPINIRIKAYLQEHPSEFLENIRISARYPAQEIANINRASRLNLGKMFESKSGKPGKFKPMWTITPTYIPTSKTPFPESKPVETKTKGGQTLVSRVESMERSVPSFQAQETVRGLPMYPSGPSPIQRRRSIVITEEEQYYRLPPGMKSPGPKKETIQDVVVVPDVRRGLSSASLMKSETAFGQMQRRKIRFDSGISREMRVTPSVDISRSAALLPRSDIMSGTRMDTLIVTEPRVDISQGVRSLTITQTKQMPEYDRIDRITRMPPPEVPPVIPGGFLPGGGGGYGPSGNLGVTRWKRTNLVATQEYLSKGIRGFASEAGSNVAEFGSTPFGGTRKRSKRKRKK